MAFHATHVGRVALIAALVVGLAAPGVFAGTCAELTADLVSFPHCVEASPDYAIAWQTDDKTLWVALDLTTDDSDAWAGFGPSEAGGMKGSDQWVVARTSAGGLAVHDLWSTKFGPPNPDAQQDVVLVAPLTEGQVADPNTPTEVASRLTEKPGRLRALLRRDLHSCDARDLSITVGLPQTFVWAHGTGWPQYHGGANRGNLQLNIVPPEGEQPVQTKPDGPLPPNTFQLDITMPNVTIPQDPTSYMCIHTQLPADQGKLHIIAQEAIVTSGPLVHHLVLYGCMGPPPSGAAGQVYDCLQMDQMCTTFVLAWAPGGDYYSFPKEAGFPFGASPDDTSLMSWFALQVHYDNRDGVAGVQDSSGLRITYTSDLRPNDLGVLILGQFNLALEPGKSRVVSAPNLCPGDCTSRIEQPFNVISTFLHMHQTGVSIVTRHVRGDTELAPIGRRRSWDFNHQGLSAVPKETAVLMPGDSLITQCSYNTLERTNITRFGEGTQDEMCVNVLVGWPAPKLSLCVSLEPDAPVAMCGALNQFPAGDSPESFQIMMERGLLSNVTWPSEYTRYEDTVCQSDAVTTFATSP